MNYKWVLLAAVLENSYYLPISLTAWKIGSCLPGEVNTKRIFRNPTTQVVHISEKAKGEQEKETYCVIRGRNKVVRGLTLQKTVLHIVDTQIFIQ